MLIYQYKEIKSHNLFQYNNDREDLENTLERRFTLISDLYKELLKDYFAKTADNRKKLEKLRPKDTMMLNIIIKQERRTGENFVRLLNHVKK